MLYRSFLSLGKWDNKSFNICDDACTECYDYESIKFSRVYIFYGGIGISPLPI